MKTIAVFAVLLPLAMGWNLRETLESYRRASYDCGPIKAAWQNIWAASQKSPHLSRMFESGVRMHLMKLGESPNADLNSQQIQERIMENICDVASASSLEELITATGEHPTKVAMFYNSIPPLSDGDKQLIKSVLDFLKVMVDSEIFNRG